MRWPATAPLRPSAVKGRGALGLRVLKGALGLRVLNCATRPLPGGVPSSGGCEAASGRVAERAATLRAGGGGLLRG